MLVTYTPEDGDAQSWEFKPGRVRASEAEVIERRYGGTWDEFTAGVTAGNMRARRALLWALLRRDHATLRFEDTPDFYADEMTVQFTVAELTDIREKLSAAKVDPDKREQMLSALDVELTEATAREAGATATAGKAR